MTIRRFTNRGYQPVCSLPSSVDAMLRRALAGRRSLLDYGCGYGGWLAYFLEVNKSCSYSTFDIDKSAEKHAQSIAPSRYQPRSRGFDAIACFAVLEILPYEDQLALLEKLSNMLEYNGVLLIQYNTYNPMSIRWIMIWIASLGNPRQYHDSNRFKRSYLSPSDVERILQSCGMKIIEKERGPIFHKFPRWFDRLISKMLRFDRIYSQFFYVLQK